MRNLSKSQDGEIKKLKEQIEALQEEVKKSKKLSAIGTMASSIAHEIKNPLVAVKTFFDLLPTKYEDPEFRDSFSLVVKQEVDRINELVTHLLDFARPKKPEFEKVNLHPLINETLDFLSLQVTDSKVQILSELQNESPTVWADRGQIARVFMNIVLNGVQAMHNGGKMEVVSRSNGEISETLFKDNGPGISKENLPKIFDPFFSTKHKGTGLGLAICQQIIQDHKGEIRVESQSCGTEFSVILPVCK